MLSKCVDYTGRLKLTSSNTKHMYVNPKIPGTQALIAGYTILWLPILTTVDQTKKQPNNALHIYSLTIIIDLVPNVTKNNTSYDKYYLTTLENLIILSYRGKKFYFCIILQFHN